MEWMLTMRVCLLPVAAERGLSTRCWKLWGWPTAGEPGLLDLVAAKIGVPKNSLIVRRARCIGGRSTGLKVYGEGWRCVNTAGPNGGRGASCMWGVNEATGEVVAQTLTSHNASQPKLTRRWRR